MQVDAALERARRLYAERAWAAARTALLDQDAVRPLEPADLVLASIAAYMTGQDAQCVQLMVRTYEEFLAAGDRAMAARAAFWLCFALVNTGDVVHAGAWAERSKRLIGDGDGVDAALLAYHETLRAHQLIDSGHPDQALPLSLTNIDLACDVGEPDLEALGRVNAGQALVALGRPHEALAHLDQVILAVESERLSPPVAGLAYCAVILACLRLFDLRRARDWTAALTAWCDVPSADVPYRGQCQVHRAHVMTLQGDWAGALAEARTAVGRLDGHVLGEAYYRLAELFRLRGQTEAAEDAYREANACGRQPEPGLSRLRLAQGRVDAAVRAMRALHAEPGRHDRAEILAAYVEVMLAAGEVDAAADAAAELATVAADSGIPLLQAEADEATASVLLARGDPAAALPLLRPALRRRQELGTPYEAAVVQVRIGSALDAMGDVDSARMSYDAARAVFERLGARPALDALEPPDLRRGGVLTAREIDVVRLVARGHTNRAIARELRLSEKTVARHLSNVYAKLDLPSRAAATAYAYDHDVL
ncbi:MAG: LuxR C-terminal-related transcriptional regulator [Dermatophilaceae bacterium]